MAEKNIQNDRFIRIFHIFRARNWPRPIVRADRQSWKDEFSFNELVLLDECTGHA